MVIRKDGLDRRNKLLAAAAEVFAEKGYRNTTVAEICKQARSNIAAVNYHFGTKDTLYAEVWRRAFEQALRVYPPDGGLPDDAPAEQRLAALIESTLHRMLDTGTLGISGKLLIMELANPTEVITAIKRDVIGPLHQRTEALIKELLGPGATKDQVFYCQMSVIHQCMALGLRRMLHLTDTIATESKLKELATHITRFSLAGIKAIRSGIEEQTAGVRRNEF
ncbi:MAG: CerR family C-terminal domain-containing protein [Sedimentisphaerales bacterium]|nr:CerR family C-terminal domain-containing protein [Sedimentisphaerales bacterium]